ncbi:MAG: protein-L-isoaspartate O-methyltransferase [Armatimonadetes bacterium]|nr:protein-L-isoaspartate O-methyltransferase [Armatimonadota bacterium]
MVALIAAALCLASPLVSGPPDYAEERDAMVGELRGLGIRDERVLTAVHDVPRHRFVQERDRTRAYRNVDLPAGGGRSSCRPYVAALSAQVLNLKPDSRVLQVGAECGYQTAVLAKLTPHVHVIDQRPGVADAARSRLRAMGYTSVVWMTGDACKGWEEHAPYDAILVTCATQTGSQDLLKQLREGGRMIVPVGRGPGQTLDSLRKTSGRIRAETVITPFRTDPMACERPSP